MKFYLFIFMTIFAGRAVAHGEDKLGPNGGYVRMPGVFHTEVVPVDSHQLKLFLLDVSWENPSIKNSKVNVKIGAKKLAAKCLAKDKLYFLCTFPNKIDLSKRDILWVEAVREGKKGQMVKYDLPLALDGKPMHE